MQRIIWTKSNEQDIRGLQLQEQTNGQTESYKSLG